jgi:hypothetical protein
MVAHVIELNNSTKAVAHETRSEAELTGFAKALAVVSSLKGSSMVESKSAIENWHAASMLSAGERDELWKYYGWGAPS